MSWMPSKWASTLRSCLVERAAGVALGGGDEFIVEAEAVEEVAQQRIVVRGEAVVGVPNGLGTRLSGLPEVLRQQRLVGDVVGHLAQPVHVVGERDQPGRRAAAQLVVSMADHRGAQHFGEGADVGQAGRAVAGLEQHRRRRRACRRASASAACALPRTARPCWSCAAERKSALNCCPFVLVAPRVGGEWPLHCPFPCSMQPMRGSGCSKRARARRARRSAAKSIGRLAETPHILLNAPLVGQRLGYADVSGLDLLELFAFVHPARFAVPTVAGMARAAGLDEPDGDSSAAAALRAIAGRLARPAGGSRLGRARGGVDRQPVAVAARLGLGAVGCRAPGQAGARRADAVLAADRMGGERRAAAAADRVDPARRTARRGSTS